MKKKVCELCGVPAWIYCESDEASLCWDCDQKVHAANFLVAKHSRTVLCHACQSPTPWKASGPKLGRTISICHACVSRSDGDDRLPNKGEASTSAADESEVEERGVEQVTRSAVADDDDSEESRRDEVGENDDSEDDDESEVDEDNDSVYSDDFGDDDNENQVVPWTSITSQAAAASSSGDDEEEDNSSDSNYYYAGVGDRNFSEIRLMHQTALFDSSSMVLENTRTATTAKDKDYTPSTDAGEDELSDFNPLKRRRLLINEHQV